MLALRRLLVFSTLGFPPLLTVILAAAFLALAAPSASGQTVESVLRAVQERKLMVAYRDKLMRASSSEEDGAAVTGLDLIVWPDEVPSFPTDGTISQFVTVLRSLNRAVIEMERLQREFVAIPSQSVILPLRLEGDNVEPLKLSAIGRVTEDNWRGKIVEIASKIRLYQHLPWPLTVNRGEATESIGDELNESFDFGNTLQSMGELAGPNDNETAPELSFSLGPRTIWDAQVFQWSFGSQGYKIQPAGVINDYGLLTLSVRALSGLRVDKTVPTITGIENAPVLGGGVTIWRRGMTPGVAWPMQQKLGETYPAVLGWNHYTKLHEAAAVATPLVLGSISPDADTISNAYERSRTLLGLPSISVGGAWVPTGQQESHTQNPEDTESPADHTKVYYHFHSEAFGINPKRGSGIFGIHLIAICKPTFSDPWPLSAKSWPVPPVAPGHVETMGSDESVRIHLGRGKVDNHQSAWLTMRRDGFGVPMLRGAMADFEVLYQTSAASFEDAAVELGGGTKGSLDIPPGTQIGVAGEGAGWYTNSYLLNYNLPRLKQIMGSDVLVDVAYPTSYSKVLRFYWANQVGAKNGNFYQLNGGPFKTIQLSNPTAPSGTPGFPLSVDRSSVIEDEVVYHGITASVEEIIFGEGESEYVVEKKKWILSTGPSPAVSDEVREIETEVPPDWTEPSIVPWTQRRTFGGVTTVWSLQCELGRTPSDVDIPIVWNGIVSVEGTNSEPPRTFVNEWHQPEPALVEWILARTVLTGPLTWQMHGSELQYDVDGCLILEKQQVAGKEHTRTWGWVEGSTRTAQDSFIQQLYRHEKITYQKEGPGNQFLKVSSTVDGNTVTSTYADPLQTYPWSLSRVSHLGGYEQMWLRNLSGVNAVILHKQGWSPSHLSGTQSVTVLNRFGGLVSNVEGTIEGIAIRSATGSNFTSWGAPTVITGMRGEQSHATFQTIGPAWGLPTAWTSPTGVNGSVSGYDHLLRPTGGSDGFSQFFADYSNPLQSKVVITDEGTITADRTAFGEVTSFKDSRPGGMEAGLTPGSAFMKVDGRQVGLKLSESREILGRDSGLGSRGVEEEWSVEAGQLCRNTNELTEGNAVHVSAKTYFDGQGRVVKISRPGPQGSAVSERWEYNAASRSVHYFPVPGPSSKEVIQTLSADGSKLEVQEVGGTSMEYIRSVEDGSLVTTTRVLDDSTEGGGWKQLSRQEYNPGIGQSRTVPWDLDTATSTTTISAATGTPPTTTISSTGGQGDTQTVTLRRGRPERIEGQSGGVEYVLDDWDYQNARLTGVSGDVEGIDIGMQWDSQGRLTHEWGPGFDLKLDYGGAPGFEVTLDDDVQDTVKVFRSSAVGDLTEWSGDVERELSVTTQDLPGGQRSVTLKNLTTPPTLVPHLTLKQGGDGSLKQKDYDGGLVENLGYELNGALASFGTGPEAATVTYGVGDAFTTHYAGGLNVTEDFYSVGLRKLVSGPNDSRGFKYLRGQLSEEKHTSGLWNGWTLARTQDDKGRVDGIGLSKSGETSIGVGYFHDQYGRVGAVGSAIYQYDTKGRLFKCFRDPLTTTWTYDAQGRIDDVHTVNTKGPDINFHHGYNPRGLRVTRTSTGGQSWTGMTYDRRGRLTRATLTNGTVLNYGYDDGGNRNSGGSSITYVINRLDQVRGRELGQRGYGVQGSVAPGARVQVSHPLAPDGEEIPVDPVTGAYHGFWTVTGDWSGGGVTQVKMLVRGTLTGAGTAGTDAVADKEVWTVVPATQEELTYDGAGRLVEDSEWVYTWNGLGHLTAAVRNGGTSREPDMVGEALVFQYDSDGRRVEKIHTRTYANSVTKLKVSRLMWDGWTPVFEDRLVDGVALARRKFVWGRDVSGTLDGAGGIGGLLAIQEVGGRTLLPVDDGLGNIVRVIDQATGNTVAKYDYAPYGESVEQWGELDACPFRYQSKYLDTETGLSYFGFRYYSANLGRWISRDPLGEAGGFNLYGYCGNDPVNRWDYLGMLDGAAMTIEEITSLLSSSRGAGFGRALGAGAATNPVGWAVMGGMFMSAGIDPDYTAAMLPPKTNRAPTGFGPTVMTASAGVPLADIGATAAENAKAYEIGLALLHAKSVDRHGNVIANSAEEQDFRINEAWKKYLYDRNYIGESAARRFLNYAMDAIMNSYDGSMGRKMKSIPKNGSVVSLDPTLIGFSQNSVTDKRMDLTTGKMRNFFDLVESLRKGWSGAPINVVMMQDGVFTSIDNTRLLAARTAKVNVVARVRGYDEILTKSEAAILTKKGYPIPVTWGDAVHVRIQSQTGGDFGFPFKSWPDKFPYGSLYDPEIK